MGPSLPAVFGSLTTLAAKTMDPAVKLVRKSGSVKYCLFTPVNLTVLILFKLAAATVGFPLLSLVPVAALLLPDASDHVVISLPSLPVLSSPFSHILSVARFDGSHSGPPPATTWRLDRESI